MIRKIDFSEDLLPLLEAEAKRRKTTLSGLLNLRLADMLAGDGWVAPEPHLTLEAERAGRDVPGFVYCMAQVWPETPQQLFKLGFSSSPLRRLEQIAKKDDIGVELVLTIPTSDMRRLERELHDRYARFRRHGEWFALEPHHLDELRLMAGGES